MSYAGATADSKHPRSTLSVMSDPKFLHTQFRVTQIPHKITIFCMSYVSRNIILETVPFRPKYLAVGNLCIKYPVGISKARYVT